MRPGINTILYEFEQAFVSWGTFQRVRFAD